MCTIKQITTTTTQQHEQNEKDFQIHQRNPQNYYGLGWKFWKSFRILFFKSINF